MCEELEEEDDEAEADLGFLSLMAVGLLQHAVLARLPLSLSGL